MDETDLAIKDMSPSTPVSTQPSTPIVPYKTYKQNSSKPTLHIIPTDYDTVNTTPDSEYSNFELSMNLFGPSYSLYLPVKGDHPTLGFNLITHTDNARIILKDMLPSTPAHKIPLWRSTLRQAILIAINDDIIDTIP